MENEGDMFTGLRLEKKIRIPVFPLIHRQNLNLLLEIEVGMTTS